MDIEHKVRGKSIAWKEMENLLIALGEKLTKHAVVVVIGSAVCMIHGQPERMTMDIDVWRRDSSFDLNDLRAACEACGIAFDPRGYDEPDSVYLQIIEPGIVQLGIFDETESLLKTGNLEIRRPPLENVVASKLVRGLTQDLDDCAFLIKKGALSFRRILDVIATIDDDVSREAASDNLAMIQALMPPAQAKLARGISRSSRQDSDLQL